MSGYTVRRIPGVDADLIDSEILSELQEVYRELDRMREALNLVAGMPFQPAVDIARAALRMGHH